MINISKCRQYQICTRLEFTTVRHEQEKILHFIHFFYYLPKNFSQLHSDVTRTIIYITDKME